MMKTKLYLRILSFAIFQFTFIIIVYAQNNGNIYGLRIINNIEEYENSINIDSSNMFIDIKKIIPNIVLDIKYATKDNFLNEPIYNVSVAYARKPVVAALNRIQKELNQEGLGLKIWDAYRPYSVTEYFYEKTKDTVFVAVPWRGSRHNRGCAVDITLIYLKSGKELKMPTEFDDFTSKAHPDYMNLQKKKILNRALLISIMEKYGFKVYYAEWWHFDYEGWENYDLMDIPFELLLNTNN